MQHLKNKLFNSLFDLCHC